jgi:hypothetical protein
MTNKGEEKMAMSEQPACATCIYKSEGNTEIIICQNPMHFGLAMRKEEFCGLYTPVSQPAQELLEGEGKVHRRVIGDTVGMKTAGVAGGPKKKKEDPG